MDPNACLARILSALDASDFDEFGDAMSSLYDWLKAGGFAPDTSDLGTHKVAVGYPGMTEWSSAQFETQPRMLIVCRASQNHSGLEFHLHTRGFDAFRGDSLTFRREW